MNGPTLLAMAPSGEILMVRDDAGRAWLIQPPGAGPTRPIDEVMAQRAVTRHGFVWVDQAFPDWAALDRFRSEQAERIAPAEPIDWESLDSDDVEEFLQVGREWLNQGDNYRARKLATELLRSPLVLENPELLEEALRFLEQLEEPQLTVGSEPSNERQAAARERWHQASAA